MIRPWLIPISTFIVIASHVTDIQRVKNEKVYDDKDFIEANATIEQDGSIAEEDEAVEYFLVQHLPVMRISFSRRCCFMMMSRMLVAIL